MGEPQHTFLFADLAGFTALTEAHGDQEAADVAEAFFATVRELLVDHRAQEVKTIGDAMMLCGSDAAAAIDLGLRIVGDIGEQHGWPMVRVGMHTGMAVRRKGDWFGSAVNLAARVSGVASGGEVLLTEATKRDASPLCTRDVLLHERGRHAFKNVGVAVLLFAATRTGERASAGLPIDPVCRMAIDPLHRAGHLTYEGVAYSFCSLHCAGAFAADPGRYTGRRP